MNTTTLLQDMGGPDAAHRLAHAWHVRVLADPVVAHAFSHGFHPQHTERLAAYWVEAWGGPAAYSSRFGSESDVVRMHSGNGVHEEMDAQAIACFALALDDIGLDDAWLRQALLDYFSWATHARMAAYPASPDHVPDDLRIARWSREGLLGEN